MRELSRREFYLLLICPGILIVSAYYFIYNAPAQNTLIRLGQSVSELRRSITSKDQAIAAAEHAPSPPVSKAMEEISLLDAQIEREKQWATLNAHPASMLPMRWTSPAGRVQAMRMIGSVFEDSNLIVISRQRENDNFNVVPTEFEDFADAVKRDGGHPIPEVWRIDAVGTYDDMLKALDRLGGCDTFILPLAVEMKVLAADPTRRMWSLWVWV